MKTKRLIARLLCIAMMLAFTVGWAQAGPLDLPSTPTATLNVTVDGAPLTVTNYNGRLCGESCRSKGGSPVTPMTTRR